MRVEWGVDLEGKTVHRENEAPDKDTVWESTRIRYWQSPQEAFLEKLLRNQATLPCFSWNDSVLTGLAYGHLAS